MSDNRYGTGLARRIREWDDAVEEGDLDYEEARKPFDGGVMLALATLFEAWDEEDLPATPRIERAMSDLRDTVEQVIGGVPEVDTRPCPACKAQLGPNETHWSIFPEPMGGYVCPQTDA